MRQRKTYPLPFLFSCLLLIPGIARCQSNQGGLDAVKISATYYNSVVKILLYDSSIAKSHPDKAYLGRGSGFFISKDGYIFTNRHVIDFCYRGFYRYTTYNQDEKKYDEGFDKITPDILTNPNISKITYVGRPALIVQVFTNVKGDSFKLYHAQVMALDTDHFDGAIIKINSDLNGKPVSESFHPVPVGNSDSINQGQDLCLLGFPAQYAGTWDEMLHDLSTLLLGKHSGYDFKYNATYGFIKTDAAINSGNSGGPVFGPNNKVIGIATAAFDKTNIGLVGPIDAMSYVAAVVPGLEVPGLSPPGQKPGFSTAALYKPIPLPNAKAIRKANSMAGKTGMANSRAYLMIGVEYGISGGNDYTINSFSNPEYLPAAGMGTTSSNEYRATFRIIKPTFLKQRNNLVGYFFNLEPGVLQSNWTSDNSPVKPAFRNPATVAMKGTQGDIEPNIYFSFGFSYTYLFTHDIGISVYYGPCVDFDIPGTTMQIGNIDSASYQSPISYSRGISILQTAGLAFKLKALYLALDFHFANSMSINYQIPYQITQGNTNGNVINATGRCQRSSVSLVLGAAL